MNRAKTPRLIALLASAAVTFLIVQGLAELGHPLPQASATLAQAERAGNHP